MEEKPSGRNPSFYRISPEVPHTLPGWPTSWSQSALLQAQHHPPAPGMFCPWLQDVETAVYGHMCLRKWESCPHYLVYREHWVLSTHWTSSSQCFPCSDVSLQHLLLNLCCTPTFMTPLWKSCACACPSYSGDIIVKCSVLTYLLFITESWTVLLYGCLLDNLGFLSVFLVYLPIQGGLAHN